MRLLLKLFAAPVMLVLTILAAMLMFLFDICSFLLTVAFFLTARFGMKRVAFLYAHPTRRVHLPVSGFPAFPLWIAGGCRASD